MQLNQQHLVVWINALRHGQYARSDRWLRTENNEFSALGVLCDLLKELAGLEWELTTIPPLLGQERSSQVELLTPSQTYTMGGQFQLLPNQIANLIFAGTNRAGIPDQHPTILIHNALGIENNWRFVDLRSAGIDHHLSLQTIASCLERDHLKVVTPEPEFIIPDPTGPWRRLKSIQLNLKVSVKALAAMSDAFLGFAEAINGLVAPTLNLLANARKNLGFNMPELLALASAEAEAVANGCLDDRSWDAKDLSKLLELLPAPDPVTDRIRRRIWVLVESEQIESQVKILALLEGLRSVRQMCSEPLPIDEYVEPAPEPDALIDEGEYLSVDAAIIKVFGVSPA